jgi:predicted dehydrogenase
MRIQFALLQCFADWDDRDRTCRAALSAQLGFYCGGLQTAPHKPMITTVEKAQRLISARDQSCSPVVIGFQGALSPLVADTRKRAATAEFGELMSVAGMNPRDRVLPLPRALEAATGLVARGLYVRYCAHMMNTVCFLPDADRERVSARINSRERTLMSVCAAAGHQRTASPF